MRRVMGVSNNIIVYKERDIPHVQRAGGRLKLQGESSLDVVDHYHGSMSHT